MPGTAFNSANWRYYQSATGSAFAAAHTDFTLLIDIGNFSAEFGSNIQSDGGDIRCTKADGTELPFDLIDFDYNSGDPTGIIRVKFSGAGATGSPNVVRVWYGYTGGTAVAYDASETYGSYNAYDSNTEIYLPLHDANDRTSNGRDGTPTGTPSDVTGKIGGAKDFGGSSYYALSGLTSVLSTANSWTVSFWMKRPATPTTEGVMGSAASGSDAMGITLRNDNELRATFYDGSFVSKSGSIGSTAWHQITMRKDGSSLALLINNAAATGSNDASLSITVSTTIGNRNGGTLPYYGALDDVQISSVARPDAWITDEYNQSNDNATWWGAWSETDTGGGGTPIGIAGETDSAQPLAPRKRRGVGISAETDAAQQLSPLKRRTIDLADETDSALPLIRRKRRALGIATETDAGESLASRKRRALGIAAESDQAESLAARKRRVLGLAGETDTALPLSPGSAGEAIGIAIETDTAMPLLRRKRRALGIAIETDTALALSRLLPLQPITATGIPLTAPESRPHVTALPNRGHLTARTQRAHITAPRRTRR